MGVAEGRLGSVTVGTTTGARHTVLEQVEWTLGGIDRNMIDYTAFGDTVRKFKGGMLNPGTITLRGWFDPQDTTGQARFITMMSSGTAISNTTTNALHGLQLWTNTDTNFDGYGFFSCTGSSGEVFITSAEFRTSHEGLAEANFTMQVSKGVMAFSSST